MPPTEQPAAQADSAPLTVEQRIAAKFGVPPDDVADQRRQPPIPDGPQEDTTASDTPEPETEQAAEPAASEPEVVEIEFEGNAYQVPPELKDALMRQADYTRKTQETAELRKTLETQAKALQEARQFEEQAKPYLEQLSTLNAQLKQYEAVKWNELSTDDLIRYKMSRDALVEQRDALAGQIEGEQAKFKQKQQETLAELTQRGNEALTRMIPNWGKGVEKEVAAFAASLFGPDATQGIYDPNVVSVLHDAMQYRNLQASKGATSKVVAKAPPVVKPGATNPMPQDVKDKLNFRKAIKSARGSQEKARLIEQRLANRFG